MIIQVMSIVIHEYDIITHYTTYDTMPITVSSHVDRPGDGQEYSQYGLGQWMVNTASGC